MAKSIPAGARWYKFDFHCHTPASECYGQGVDQDYLRELSPRDWLFNYMRAEIDCIAVTDHNTGDWIDKLKNEYLSMQEEGISGFRELTIFPGIEVTASGGEKGIHILTILPTEKSKSDIDHFLGKLEYNNNTIPNNKKISGKTALAVCTEAKKNKFLPIPAHVDNVCGLFTVLKNGPQMQDFLDQSGVYAVELLSPNEPKPQEYISAKCSWTEVIGSDSHHLSAINNNSGNYPGSRYTWVKMGANPTFEGLKLALQDGQTGDNSSIIRSDENEFPFDPNNPQLNSTKRQQNPNNRHAENVIESLSISNAQFCGRPPLEIKWNPWLNCIVGGRGSGKSTLVELARIVLRREDELVGEPKENFTRFKAIYNKENQIGALSNETEILLIYTIGQSKYRLRWRQDSQGHTIEDQDPSGVWHEAPGEIANLFPARIYSQKQVFELSRNTKALFNIIDESKEVNRIEWEVRWQQEESNFFSLRDRARQIQVTLGNEERLKGQHNDILKKLAVFESEGYADILKQYQSCHRQKQQILDLIDQTTPYPNLITELIEQIELPELDEQSFENTSNYAELMESIIIFRSVIETAKQDLLQISNRLIESIKQFKNTVWHTKWSLELTEADNKFETLKQKLAQVGTSNPNEYGVLVQQRQSIETEFKKIGELKVQLKGVHDQANQSYQKLHSLQKELTKKREEFLTSVLDNNNYIRIKLMPYGDKKQAEQQFRSIIGKEGSTFSKEIYSEENNEGIIYNIYESYDSNSGIETFENQLYQLKCSIYNRNFQVGQRFKSHLDQLRPEQYDRLFTWWPEDSLQVEYSNGDKDGDWRSITQGSPGQKTAAMLAFLLSYGNEPIILDQPEDDLDNHLIYNLIVRQIRENKLNRQILVVTHNPNIVVNGDAEFVIVMDQRAGQCHVTISGSLQEPDVRKEICDVMEGGREAFEKRYRRVMLEEI